MSFKTVCVAAATALALVSAAAFLPVPEDLAVMVEVSTVAGFMAAGFMAVALASARVSRRAWH